MALENKRYKEKNTLTFRVERIKREKRKGAEKEKHNKKIKSKETNKENNAKLTVDDSRDERKKINKGGY